MICVVGTFHARPGAGAELEQVLRTAAMRVRAAEPGNRLYQVSRSRADAETYVVLEIFDSEEAYKAHLASPHAAELRPKLGPILAGPPSLVLYDAVE